MLFICGFFHNPIQDYEIDICRHGPVSIEFTLISVNANYISEMNIWEIILSKMNYTVIVL